MSIEADELAGRFWGWRKGALVANRIRWENNRNKSYANNYTVAYANTLYAAAGNLKSRSYPEPPGLLDFSWLAALWNLFRARRYLRRAVGLCDGLDGPRLSPHERSLVAKIFYAWTKRTIFNLSRSQRIARRQLELMQINVFLLVALDKNPDHKTRLLLQITHCEVIRCLYLEQRQLWQNLFTATSQQAQKVKDNEALLQYYRFAARWLRADDQRKEAAHFSQLALSLAESQGWSDQVLKVKAERDAPLFL